LAKIAVGLKQALATQAMHGGPGGLRTGSIAHGNGWTVEDVICTAGPWDRPFEERHAGIRIAVVAAGSFQYRAGAGRELMTPGCLLLGNVDQCFECGHTHGTGDRCLSFGYASHYFEQLAADIGVRPRFHRLRLPPLRALSGIVAQVCARLELAENGSASSLAQTSWEELSMSLAVQTLRLDGAAAVFDANVPESSVARVARAARMIDDDPSVDHTLGDLAREARLSRYHFIRTFQRLTGLTPHKYVVRARLREAAIQMAQ
jgi:AraC family transcriptional regulator